MLRKAIYAMGEEAARMFYHTRKHAMPPTALMLLQDKGSVQLMDGEAHRQRKQMFISLMSPAQIQQLADLTAGEWHASIKKWEHRDEVILHDEVQEILCRAVCRWAGIPLTEPEAKQRTHEFGAMIDGAGAVGPRNWRGLLLRTRTERWGRNIIRRTRRHEDGAIEGSAAHLIAWHQDAE